MDPVVSIFHLIVSPMVGHQLFGGVDEPTINMAIYPKEIGMPKYYFHTVVNGVHSIIKCVLICWLSH